MVLVEVLIFQTLFQIFLKIFLVILGVVEDLEIEETSNNVRGSDLRYDLSISLEDAFLGKKENISFSTHLKNVILVKVNGSAPGSLT